jgi:hypothetical protein
LLEPSVKLPLRIPPATPPASQPNAVDIGAHSVPYVNQVIITR